MSIDPRPHPAPSRSAPTALDVRVEPAAAPDALFTFEFTRGTGNIPCPACEGVAPVESWSTGGAVEHRRSADLAYARAGDFAFVSIQVDESGGDILGATETAYRRLLAHVRNSPTPNILRIWNYFAEINRGNDDHERYRRFCVGRANAVDARFNDPPPAATAIGSVGTPDALQVIALCSTMPGIALENPRQTPAWRYPREHGPVSPGFSRAALVGSGRQQRLLVSGTASIVGHVSQHIGDPLAQVEETFANLQALLVHASAHSDNSYDLSRCASLRIYLRDPTDLPAVRTAVQAHLPNHPPLLFLHGEVCRRELALELEGVFLPG